eukprot:TRINITY_DN2111_c0_g1_i2.p2 TRINITY_DN2111_c0_g1~~TRINITY_DN2111_c0_g1_i2.p2  ORF type:complete len:108 (-),score=3.92 TRINITY_DN2111_c0_g1_i2:61-384(-)
MAADNPWLCFLGNMRVGIHTMPPRMPPATEVALCWYIVLVYTEHGIVLVLPVSAGFVSLHFSAAAKLQLLFSAACDGTPVRASRCCHLVRPELLIQWLGRTTRWCHV